MAILANGFRDTLGAFQTFGATVSNNAYPSARWANTHRTAAMRNIDAGEGITDETVSLPSGYRNPGAWMMPQKAGALAARNRITGAGGITADILAVKLAEAIITGTGELTATGGLIVQALAALTGLGTITDADVKAFLAAVANISGTGTVSAGDLEGLGAVLAALTGVGTAAGSTATGTGELSADLVVTGTGLTTGNVGAAVWQQIIEAGFSAEQILRILAAQAAGAATGLEGANPQFTGIDGVTIRIDGTYSGGTRTIDSLDGD